MLVREIQVLTVQQEISSQARGEMDRSQREYYLRQQLKAIQEELGEGEELAEEIDGYRTKAEEKGLPEEAREEMERQIRRLERSHPESAETVDHPHLPRLAHRPALGEPQRRQPRHRARRGGPRRGPLRPREGQGAHPRVPGGAQAEPAGEGADPLLRRPARRRQDLARPLDRPRPGPQVRPPHPGRRARRGGDPRPPPHLRRRHARPHPPGHAPGRTRQPGLHARRDRQDRLRLPRRPVLGAARGARPGAELDLPRPLPGGALRPVAGHVHHHRQPPRPDPARLPRPHGGDPALRLHRGGEARDRAAPPDPQADRRQRPDRRRRQVHRAPACGG